ncbi:HipA family kinase [Chloroflexus aggregans]|uniref:HipA-like kinase domain-containing protein n=1 Tax=Chloroflexus aggregans (strain MD-66 / DSM 9485) TaxID=326427 RepID=B8G7M7_CHLAD|nr:HipA family kinase [Chloroflexus aggregans]ACL26062.1 conserved hypothetical protein [Chloroflexus aggregans DSM 9485]
MLRRVTATRYVEPLREGGSLPAIVEADDDGLYVVKFRGAGQGPKVLVAELICGELARAVGLPAPELVLIEVDPALGRNEPDGEIQDLVMASAGLNLAVDFLPGALAFEPTTTRKLDPKLASMIVWFDAFITNVDRTPRNTNMLWWHRQLFLIDHGAALYMHYTWHDYQQRARAPFNQIRDHVLLPAANDLAAADTELTHRITPELLREIVELVPDEWLVDPRFPSVEAHREAYIEYLSLRLAAPRAFVQEAIDARERL